MVEATFTSVSKMLNALSEDETFNKDFAKQISERTVTKSLQAMRIARDISQEQIANALNCSQSRISKIEAGEDANLRLEEIGAYAMAFDCDISIVLARRGETAVERVKRNAFAINEELRRLAECAKNDDLIAKAVSVFFGEAFVNIVRMLQNASEKLTVRSVDGKPHITILESCDAASTEVNPEFPKLENAGKPKKKGIPRLSQPKKSLENA